MAASVTYTDRTLIVLGMIEAAAGAAVKQTADEMADALRDEMQQSKSGQWYGSHQASAPGEVPANWHGTLLGTVRSEQTGPTSAEYGAGGPEAPYLAEYLEYGSPGGRIAPRPMITPSAEIAGPLLRENVTVAIKEAIG